jgi:hypothetical protein
MLLSSAFLGQAYFGTGLFFLKLRVGLTDLLKALLTSSALMP